MRDVAVIALVAIAKIKISKEWVVKEALKYYILVAGCASVIDAP